MASISLQPVGPSATIVHVGKNRFYFSYETCVAMSLNNGEKLVRRESDYSNTTRKHMREMQCYDWERISDETFEEVLDA